MSDQSSHPGQPDPSNPFDRQRGKSDEDRVGKFLMMILVSFSVSVELLFRRKFGERYYNAGTFVMALFALTLVLYGVNGYYRASGYGIKSDSIGATFIGDPPTPEQVAEAEAKYPLFAGYIDRMATDNGIYVPVEPFILLFFGGVGLFHLLDTWDRSFWRKERWHSRVFGISNFDKLIGKRVGPFVITDWTLLVAVEPAVILLLAGICYLVPLPRVLFGWLLIAGVTMLVKNYWLYRRSYNEMLDLIDKQIEAEYFSKALEGRDKQETAGFTLARPAYLAREIVPEAKPDYAATLNDVMG